MRKIKRGILRNISRFFAMVMALTLLLADVSPVYAVTLNELKKQKEDAKKQQNNAQDELDLIQSKINDMTGEKDEMEEEIEQIDEELVDLLLSIDIITDDIDAKNLEIEDAQVKYEEALFQEVKQLEAMKRRIKFMYEKGDPSYLTVMLESKNMAEVMNKVDYSEKLYEYDRKMLEEYEIAKQTVKDTKQKLEVELSELEEIQQDMEEQKVNLQEMIDERQETLDNFDEQLSAAKDKASSYKSQIKEQAAAIKQLEAQEAAKIAEEAAKKKAEEEARKKAEEEAKKKAEEEGKQPEGDGQDEQSQQQAPSQPASPGDASKGQEIANYACQFVGNPYVAGGTSLTDGCDCSGFTSSVYAHFGISLPRSSYAQSAAGREVSYAEAQPGDVMYYGGHVAIYIGNNLIVHASTAATGIKISNSSYRTVITIRRFV